MSSASRCPGCGGSSPDRLTRSWTTTPHFTVTVAVDMRATAGVRLELKANGTTPVRDGFRARGDRPDLVEFPDVNTRRRWHGARPSTARAPRARGRRHRRPAGAGDPRRGLAVDRRAPDRSQELITGARAGTLKADDLSGGTFTVSNLGMLGVEEFAAIINPGEGAILAVASADPDAGRRRGGHRVRPIMKITLSADHRVVDGETGARFLGALRRRLEAAEELRALALAG